jgi:hypothetical protein
MWGEKDSNLRSRKTTDLQSVPVGHFGISPDYSSEWTENSYPYQLSKRATCRNRTSDLLITNQLLYQLS